MHFVAQHADKTFKNQLLAAKDKKRRELLQKGKVNSEDGSSTGEDSEVEESKESSNVMSLIKDTDKPWTTNNEDQLLKLINDNNEARQKELKEKEKNVDPNAFLQINVNEPNFSAGDNIGDVDSSDGEGNLAADRSKIYEAFAEDDDIMRDFKKEAKEKQEAKNKKKKSARQTMPGWGSWVGTTSSEKVRWKNNRAKNRARMLEKRNGPKEAKDDKVSKGYQIIINESAKGQTARNHQATSLPFPFTGVSDFEASIRTPVGDTFIPRTSFKKLVNPKVNVAMGAIVEPVDKSELAKRGIAFEDEDRNDYETSVV